MALGLCPTQVTEHFQGGVGHRCAKLIAARPADQAHWWTVGEGFPRGTDPRETRKSKEGKLQNGVPGIGTGI